MPYDNTVYLWNSKYKMQYSMKYQTWSLHMPLNVSFIIQFLSLSRYLIVNLVNGLLTIFTQLITNMKHTSYYNIHRIISRIYISYVLVCLCTTWAHVEQLYFYYFFTCMLRHNVSHFLIQYRPIYCAANQYNISWIHK